MSDRLIELTPLVPLVVVTLAVYFWFGFRSDMSDR